MIPEEGRAGELGMFERQTQAHEWCSVSRGKRGEEADAANSSPQGAVWSSLFCKGLGGP